MSAEQTASLNALREQIGARWQTLAPRERRLVTAAAWLLGLTLVFMLGVRPAWKTLQQAPGQMREVDALLDDMNRQAAEVKLLRQLPPVPPAQAEASLRSATERLGAGASLRMQPDRVLVTLSKVPGPALAEWLREVRASARARAIEANVAQSEPGLYSGSVTLVLGAPPASQR